MLSSLINKVGVEIEGGWKTRKPNYHHDRSVNFSSPSNPLILKNKRKVSRLKHLKMRGEIYTPPTNDLTVLKNSIKYNYPDIFNKTCGFHIHVSFKVLESYALLMHHEFFEAFISTMDVWAKTRLKEKVDIDLFEERFQGKNRYCWREFKPIEQLKGDYERYTQLNFAAFRKHGTLECRLFPVFKDYRKTISATLTFLNLINFYLGKAKPTKETEKHLALLNRFSPYALLNEEEINNETSNVF